MMEKYKVRRRMAKTSFVFLMSVAAALVASWFWGGADTAAIITASTGVLTTVLLCFTGIVTAYFTSSHFDDQNERKQAEQQ